MVHRSGWSLHSWVDSNPRGFGGTRISGGLRLAGLHVQELSQPHQFRNSQILPVPGKTHPPERTSSDLPRRSLSWISGSSWIQDWTLPTRVPAPDLSASSAGSGSGRDTLGMCLSSCSPVNSGWFHSRKHKTFPEIFLVMLQEGKQTRKKIPEFLQVLEKREQVL